VEARGEIAMAVRRVWALVLVSIACSFGAATARAQQVGARDSAAGAHGDSVSIHLVDVDVRAAVQSLARYLDRPVVFGTVTAAKVTLETPAPVPRGDVIHLLRGVLQSQSLELIADSGLYRVQQHNGAPGSDAAPIRPAQPPGFIQLFSIRLRHARAADVSATVNALYGRASAVGELGSKPETLDDQLRQNQIPPGTVASPQSVAAVAGRNAAFSSDVTIVPDPRSNALLIRATQSDFDLIQAAVQELDIRPLQVLIEVTIAEVRRDRSFSLGVDASTGPVGVRGTDGSVSSTQTSQGTAGDFVLKIMGLGGLRLDAALNAGVANGDVRILSRPVIIAANNEQAQILVGSQRPFVQVSRSLPTDAASRDQVVQYKDVGTKLIVKPTISPDGYVVLEVSQEVNSATTEVAFNAPVISTRSVQTQLLIKDKQTVAMGGLVDREHDSNQGGIPLLSSIPLIGGLFGHATRRTSETELYLFLTPHIIRTDEDADSLTAPMRERARKSEQ
jgi:general secretion pathway protein D